MVRVALIVLALSLTACGGAIANGAHDATQSAVATLDSGPTKAELDDAARSLGQSAGQGLTSALLDPVVKQQLVALESRIATQVATTLTRTERALRADIESSAPGIVQAVIDQLFSSENVRRLLVILAAAREQFVGPPLQADIDAAAPHVAALVDGAVGRARAQADTEIAKWRGVAIGVGVGAGVLVCVLAALHAHAVRELRRSKP